MIMRVLLFGPVRTRLGVDHLEIEASSAEDLWTTLLRQHPGLKPLRPTIRLARDGEFLPANATFHPGDEIALIPPVSGG